MKPLKMIILSTKKQKGNKIRLKKQNECITLEADSRQQVLVGGDRVQTLPVSQLPNFTGVITTSCRQVIPECRQLGKGQKLHIYI